MNRKDIDNLIIHLEVIKNYSKEIHYNCSGLDFYDKHLFADKIIKNLDNYIDELKEVCLLGHGFKPLRAFKYLKAAADRIPIGINFDSMGGILQNTLNLIEEIKDISKADENLLGTIAQDLQNNLGLLNIMFENARE